MRCIHCPTPENLRCAGLDVRRFCELIDPSCPQYDAGYLDVIVSEVAPGRGGYCRATHIVSPAGPWQADHRRRGNDRDPADCCGGGVPPGIFDEP